MSFELNTLYRGKQRNGEEWVMRARKCRLSRNIVASVVAAFLIMPLAAHSALAQAAVQVPALHWKPCDTTTGFDCATAKVPLDHAHPAAGKIDLAVIRHAATDPGNRVGTLFFNPGGPGGAGTDDLPQWLALFPAPVVARFDIVSWDPRGIGRSTAMQCFATKDDEAKFFAGVPSRWFPVGDAEIVAWNDRFAKFARICQQRDGTLLSHVSTTDSARDMDLLRQAVGETALNYLGVSYGTYLGAVYANLFPDRVRALILDGNLDPVEWTNGGYDRAAISDGLRFGSAQGSAESLNAFLDQCGAAGAKLCAFSTGDVQGTHAKFATLLQRLQRSPATLGTTKVTYAALLTGVHGLMFTTRAEPGFDGWGKAATLLEDVWNSTNPNATTPAPGSSAPAIDLMAKAAPSPARDHAKYASDQQGSAVQCAESPNPRPAELFRSLGRFVAASFGPVGLVDLWQDSPCASWQAKATDRYGGPWDRPTANTILVIGNTHDLSTAYRNSVAMARELAKARLLTVDGYGHTALLNPSTCASQYESDYLIGGTLPPEGTVCRQDKGPFEAAQ
jgi:pimeloyl-ACP methyl ester carboxylesterase